MTNGSFADAHYVRSDHHWTDHERGLRGMRRVRPRAWCCSRGIPRRSTTPWLVREYVPAFARLVPEGVRLADAMCPLGPRVRIEPVPNPARLPPRLPARVLASPRGLSR